MTTVIINADGLPIAEISHAVVEALDPDKQIAQARRDANLGPDAEPTEAQVKTAGKKLLKAAVEPLATKPRLRSLLIEMKKSFEQIIDEVTRDELTFAGFSEAARERAKSLVQSFEQFLEENKQEIDALQFFYSKPYTERLHYKDIKAIHEAISAPPRSWTEKQLWAAYEAIEEHKVRGASAERRLTDIVSLIRFALHQKDELVPYSDLVQERFSNWIVQQENDGRVFTAEQTRWLEMVRNHVAQSLEIDIDDFELTPFVEEGGLGKAAQVFGQGLAALIDELNLVLAA